MSNERAIRTYQPPPAPARAELQHIRDILAPIVAELEERLCQRSSGRHLGDLALQKERAGVENFPGVSAPDLVLELLGLARESDEVLGELYLEQPELLR